MSAPGVLIRALGARILVEPENPRISEQVRSLWSRCLDTDDAPPSEHIWVAGPSLPMSRETDLRLTSRINLAGMRALRDHVLLHAAAVSTPDGRVLGLVAPSGTGKTTAAIALGMRGLGYVTDETLAVDSCYAVVPFPKPLSQVTSDGGEKLLTSPDALGLPVAGRHLRLHRLVVLERDPARSTPELTLLPTEDALTLLVGQSSGLADLATPLHRLRHLMDRVGGVRVLRYREISEAGDLLLDLLASTAGPTVRAATLVDAVPTDEGGLAVLHDERLMMISPVGRLVLEHARTTTSVHDLHQALALHGHDEEEVSDAIEALSGAGLLLPD